MDRFEILQKEYKQKCIDYNQLQQQMFDLQRKQKLLVKKRILFLKLMMKLVRV
jgi:hypothetical protein